MPSGHDPLGQLGAYLHQDWPLDHEDVWDAVQEFARQSSASDLAAALTRAERLRAEDLGEEGLRRVLVDDIGLGYWPPGDGLTFRTWLDQLIEVLADPERARPSSGERDPG